jgi:hypothetical protein
MGGCDIIENAADLLALTRFHVKRAKAANGVRFALDAPRSSGYSCANLV